MNFGQEFYFLPRWSLGVLSSISCLSAILETFCCPWQQANSFPVGQTLFYEFFFYFLIYPPFWIQLLPLATRILFPVKLWPSSVSPLWFFLYLYSLFPLATSVGCIYKIQCLVLSYQFVLLSDNLSLRTHLAYIL